MTRTMYDGVDAKEVPAGAAIYAGYVDGEWPSYGALTTLHPGALHLSICVTATAAAQALDVENGDATPAQAPGWAEDQRRAGNPYPVVYMNAATWPAVRQEFADQAVADPLYWVADYVPDPTKPPAIPDGAIAIQYYDFGGYDASAAADYWPGLDAAPASTASATALEEDDMQIEPLSVHPTEYAYAFAPDKETLVLVADGYGDPPAQLRVAVWNQNDSDVTTISLGGSSGLHTVGHDLPSGATGVTIRRLDSEDYPVGIAFE